MTASSQNKSVSSAAPTTELDVVVIGAGYAGLYALHYYRQLGYKTRLYDKAGGVGGTWYWNRYPGARVDIESLEYSYSFSEDIQQNWKWSERYASQPELMRYLNWVADRLELRPDIQLDSELKTARYDESTDHWHVGFSTGETVVTRFLVLATGILSAAKDPAFKNRERFKGQVLFTSSWPHEPVSFKGKRVAVIGTGSSGIQSIPEIAKQADHLTVFQRSANFAVPSCNRPMEPEFERWVKDNYLEIRERELRTHVGCAIVGNEIRANPTKATFEVSEAERLEGFERCWNAANFSYYTVFTDVLTDKKANDALGDFIRERIRAQVKDPKVAELLTPHDHPVLTRRLCAENGYYQTYNRDNVLLVDISKSGIEEFTEKGLKAGGKEYEFDIIVCATGFDAMTGSIMRMDIHGRNDRVMAKEWSEKGARTRAGMMSEGYPNLFMLNGPTSPAAFFQPVLLGEWQVRWFGRLMKRMDQQGFAAVEPTIEAENEWIQHNIDVADKTLFPLAKSWYMGDNVPGKPRVILSYLGGFSLYRATLEAAEDNKYTGFKLERAKLSKAAE